MIVETQLTQAEFVQASLFGMRKRSALRGFLLYIFPVLALFLLFLAWASTRNGHTWLSQWGLLLLAAFTGFLPQLLYPWMFRRIFRRTPLLAEPRTFEFDESGVRIRGSAYDSKATWKVFSKFAENDSVVILFQQGNTLFFPISKRKLTEQEVEELRKVLTAHLPTA